MSPQSAPPHRPPSPSGHQSSRLMPPPQTSVCVLPGGQRGLALHLGTDVVTSGMLPNPLPGEGCVLVDTCTVCVLGTCDSW